MTPNPVPGSQPGPLRSLPVPPSARPPAWLRKAPPLSIIALGILAALAPFALTRLRSPRIPEPPSLKPPAPAAPLKPRLPGNAPGAFAEPIRRGDLKEVAPSPGVHFAPGRSRETPAPRPAAAEGWEALRTGNLEKARASYERVLHEDLHNVDALRGLSAIARRQGRLEESLQQERRLIEINPRDAAAQASLALDGETGRGSPEIESRLKNLVSDGIPSPEVEFLLGNLYAGLNRWQEAGLAYSTALAAFPDNPDYHYNLAVSLEWLGQAPQATRHYERALALSVLQPPAFDPLVVRARLSALAAFRKHP